VSTTPTFESVDVGQAIGPLFKGPMTEVHLMRWSASMENWHRIHYDRRYAVEHDGLPDLLVNGSLKQHLILQLLKDWAGRDGWVWKASFQFRAMNRVGERLEVWACVTGKERAAAYGLVALELGIRNDTGIESTPGSAVVALPYAGGQAVPYPFQPPR
jgi:acyl dehydratase